MDRIHVIIIPNEEYLDIDVFSKTSIKKTHNDIIKLFYKENNLPYKEDSENIYTDLLSYQNIVIISFPGSVLAWLPNMISKKQIEILKNYQNFFKQYDNLVVGIALDDEIEEEIYDLASDPNALSNFFNRASSLSDKKVVHI